MAGIHMDRAWGCQNGVVLGQQRTDEKFNEITTIPQQQDILELLLLMRWVANAILQKNT
jgi:hypothetical protein